ncbi:MAG: hypothetical protein WKF30_05880 [Pyrinomonadaceae bacterium]
MRCDRSGVASATRVWSVARPALKRRAHRVAEATDLCTGFNYLNACLTGLLLA